MKENIIYWIDENEQIHENEYFDIVDKNGIDFYDIGNGNYIHEDFILDNTSDEVVEFMKNKTMNEDIKYWNKKRVNEIIEVIWKICNEAGSKPVVKSMFNEYLLSKVK